MQVFTSITALVLLAGCDFGSSVECPPGAIPLCPNPDPEFSVFFPHENDCNWFYHCSNGLAYCKECPAGLHWNSVLDTCDWPEDAGCAGAGPSTAAPITRPTTTPHPTRPPITRPSTITPSATQAPTSRPSTVSTPPHTTKIPEVPETTEVSVICPAGAIPVCPNPDLEFSVFFPHENDCHWFFHCSNGIAYCKECPTGLHWNSVLDTCDWPQDAGCAGAGPSTAAPITRPTTTPRPIRPPITRPSTTTPSATQAPTTRPSTVSTPPHTTKIPEVPETTEVSVICPAGAIPVCPNPDPEFSVFFPHENDCNWFFHCSNGIAYCKECPAGLHWNSVLDTCDWPEDAGCAGAGPSTAAPITRPRTTPHPTRPPIIKPTTTTRPVRPPITRPSTTTPSATQTPTTRPSTMSTPPHTTKIPEVLETTEVSVICPAGAIPVCPNPDPEFSVFFPHENDCNWFFHCSNGIAYCKECPAGLHWNSVLDTCDWPEDAGCAGAGPSTAAPITRPRTTPHPTRPPIIKPTTTTRPVRPPITRPSTTTPSATQTPTTRPSTMSTPPHTTKIPEVPETTEVSVICPAGAIPVCPNPDPELSVFFPHENDCHWFFHCSNGIAYCKECPTGLHWNSVLDTCDWPQDAGCAGAGPPTAVPITRPTTTPRPIRPPITRPSTTTLSATQAPTTRPSTVSTPPHTTKIPEVPETTEVSVICPAGAIPVCPNPDLEFSVFFPHENDCHWFFHCSNGIAYCKECPTGLHWNSVLDTCDWPQDAGCAGAGPSTAAPITRPRTTAHPTRPPIIKPTTTTRPVRPPITRPSTTTPSATQTPTTRPSTMSTPPHTTKIPEVPETTEVSVICPAGAIPVCPNPDPEFSVFFPHENDCNWFFHCSNGIAYCKECPAGLHWNSVLDTCDWPQDAGCAGAGPSTAVPITRPTTTPRPIRPPITRPSTTTPSATQGPTTRPSTVSTPPHTTKIPEVPETTEVSVICPAGAIPVCPNPDPEFSVFFPHENDCNWFFHCSNGIAYCKECPTGLHWNTMLDSCDWPESARCGRSVSH